VLKLKQSRSLGNLLATSAKHVAYLRTHRRFFIVFCSFAYLLKCSSVLKIGTASLPVPEFQYRSRPVPLWFGTLSPGTVPVPQN